MNNPSERPTVPAPPLEVGCGKKPITPEQYATLFHKWLESLSNYYPCWNLLSDFQQTSLVYTILQILTEVPNVTP